MTLPFRLAASALALALSTAAAAGTATSPDGRISVTLDADGEILIAVNGATPDNLPSFGAIMVNV